MANHHIVKLVDIFFGFIRSFIKLKFGFITDLIGPVVFVTIVLAEEAFTDRVSLSTFIS
jgi:hypothetical protein